MRERRKGLTRDEAETIAAEGLAFIAADERRLTRFLSLTGLGPDELRAALGAPETLHAVLEHIMGDESLLLVFATSASRRPEDVGAALALLSGRAV